MNEQDRTENDLLFMQTYMTAVSTAGINRDEIFEHASEKNEYVVAKHIKKIFLLVKNYGYEYSKACKLISKKVKNAMLRDFFGRFANVLTSGATEKKFLHDEMETMVNLYSSKYERDLEALKKWSDGYTALLVSLTLIVVVVLISGMIYPIGNLAQMTFLTSFLMISVCGLGIYIISRAAPKEIKLHSLPYKTNEQRLIEKLSKILLPIAAISIVILLLLHDTISQRGIDPVGLALIVAAILILPIGIIGMRDDRLIDKRDTDAPPFFKSLGDIAGTMGITTSAALDKLDKDAVGILEEPVRRLNARLSQGLDKKICWDRFVGETGSEVINRSAGIFTDAVDLGGNPSEIGEIVSASALRIRLLRMKRALVSSGFSGLVIPLHATMAGLVVFIVQIVITFSIKIGEMFAKLGGAEAGQASVAGFSTFAIIGSGDIALYSIFATIIVLILTVANTLVVKITAGGGNYKLCFYGAMMSAISGIVLIVVPKITAGIFAGL